MFYHIILVVLLTSYVQGDSELEQIFKDNKIVPDVIDEAPKEKLKIELENGQSGGDGLEYKPADTWSTPTIDWPSADANKYYAIYLGCPDAPAANNPIWSEAVHWLVLNVPGNQVDKGDMNCPYLGPVPPKTGGMMRYVYLVYEQPEKMKFDEKPINATDWEGHIKFKIKKFAEKYQLGQPLAGNIFRSQWDETVPLLHKRLGITVDE